MNNAVIAVPTLRSIEVETALALAQAHKAGYELIYQWNDAILPRSRARLVARFLKEQPDADAMVFVDSDTLFTVQDLQQLVRESRIKHTVVAAPVSLRSAELRPNVDMLPEATARASAEKFRHGPDVQPTLVKAAGTAFMAIPRLVLEALIEKEEVCEPKSVLPFWPLFDRVPSEDGTYLGDDTSFCRRLNGAGYKIWILPSLRIGHIGTTEFYLEKTE